MTYLILVVAPLCKISPHSKLSYHLPQFVNCQIRFKYQANEFYQLRYVEILHDFKLKLTNNYLVPRKISFMFLN